MGKGASKDLQILTRSRLERILIDVMRGSWQPQGPEVWKGRDNRGLPVSWQPRLGARQPGHSPDWWAPGSELQTTGQPPPPPRSLPHSLPRQSATCQAWAASNGPLPTQSQAVITRHTATDGWAGTDTSDPLRGRGFLLLLSCTCVCVSDVRVFMCVRVQVICQTTLSLAVSLFGLRACLSMYIRKVVCTARAHNSQGCMSTSYFSVKRCLWT